HDGRFPAARVEPADDRADAGAGDAVDGQPGIGQSLEHPDVHGTPQAAAAQGQAQPGFAPEGRQDQTGSPPSPWVGTPIIARDTRSCQCGTGPPRALVLLAGGGAGAGCWAAGAARAVAGSVDRKSVVEGRRGG